MPASALRVLFRDELIGFARSRVMLVLWVVVPAIAIGGYLLLPNMVKARFGFDYQVSATMYMSALTSLLAGLVAAVMVAVDIVNERSRKVYELFFIRPIAREAILWSKFLAVFVCVAIACTIAIIAGVTIDALKGTTPNAAAIEELARSLVMQLGITALSTASGIFIGVLSKTSIVAAVVIIMQTGQILPLIPLLPGFFDVLPDQFWVVQAVSLVLAVAVVQGAALLFRRAQL